MGSYFIGGFGPMLHECVCDDPTIAERAFEHLYESAVEKRQLFPRRDLSYTVSQRGDDVTAIHVFQNEGDGFREVMKFSKVSTSWSWLPQWIKGPLGLRDFTVRVEAETGHSGNLEPFLPEHTDCIKLAIRGGGDKTEFVGELIAGSWSFDAAYRAVCRREL